MTLIFRHVTFFEKIKNKIYKVDLISNFPFSIFFKRHTKPWLKSLKLIFIYGKRTKNTLELFEIE